MNPTTTTVRELTAPLFAALFLGIDPASVDQIDDTQVQAGDKGQLNANLQPVTKTVVHMDGPVLIVAAGELPEPLVIALANKARTAMKENKNEDRDFAVFNFTGRTPDTSNLKRYGYLCIESTVIPLHPSPETPIVQFDMAFGDNGVEVTAITNDGTAYRNHPIDIGSTDTDINWYQDETIELTPDTTLAYATLPGKTRSFELAAFDDQQSNMGLRVNGVAIPKFNGKKVTHVIPNPQNHRMALVITQKGDDQQIGRVMTIDPQGRITTRKVQDGDFAPYAYVLWGNNGAIVGVNYDDDGNVQPQTFKMAS